MSRHDPLLRPIPIVDLHPTQITVGYREIEERRRQWRLKDAEDGERYLGAHMVPVVLGPKNGHYILDHHHLCRALLAEGVKDMLVDVVADLRALKKTEFWTYLDHRAWCHPYDADGERVVFGEIPRRVADMPDDPYRSLASELRQAGGFAKDATPFSEFIWANYLRRRVKRKLLDDDFSGAVDRAMKLAKAAEANMLPGWCGPNTAQ